MSIAEKFNIPPALLETIKKMNAEGTEYQEKVKALMKKRGFTSIGQMSPEEKKDFFNTLDSMHKAKNEEVELDEVKVGDKVSFSYSVAAAGGRSVKKTGTVHQIDGDTVHVKVKDKYGVITHKKKTNDLMKEEVELEEDVKSAAEKIETYAKTLSTGDMDKKDFMKVASMLKRNKVKDAIKFTMSLDSDPRDYVIDVMQNNKINMKEEVELDEGAKETETRARKLSDKLSKKDPKKSQMYRDMANQALTRINKGVGSAKQGSYRDIEGGGNKSLRRQGIEPAGKSPAFPFRKEEVELEEGKSSTGYELYHKDFSSAMAHAYDFAKKKYNIEVDPQEIDRNVAMGPRKPSSGKANAYRLLDKTGKKAIQVQVANLDNKRYELNMYKEDLDQIDESMSAAQIKKLRDAYASIDNVDVSGQPYKQLVAFLDKQDIKTLKMLAGAKIKFISGMAQNRVVRKMNESIGSTVGRALGQYAGAKMGLEGPGGAHGEVLGRQLEMFARAILKKLTNEEIKLDEEETKEFMVKFEKQGKVSVKNYTGKSDLDVRSKAKVDAKRMGMTVASVRLKEEVEEAVNPQKSMKRAGLSVERAKEVMRHQKEIGTIRKKRESLRNSFDPVNTVLEAYKKNKMKKEATAKDKNKTVHSGDKLSGKTEPIEIDPELKEQKS
jgi:hypothetical protein